MKSETLSAQSKMAIKSDIHNEIKSVYVGALQCIEIKFGKDFAGYDSIRKKILDLGNDAIRNLYKRIDEDYKIEKLADIDTVYFNKEER